MYPFERIFCNGCIIKAYSICFSGQEKGASAADPEFIITKK